jgi:hypothetical protein
MGRERGERMVRLRKPETRNEKPETDRAERRKPNSKCRRDVAGAVEDADDLDAVIERTVGHDIAIDRKAPQILPEFWTGTTKVGDLGNGAKLPPDHSYVCPGLRNAVFGNVLPDVIEVLKGIPRNLDLSHGS